MLVQLAFRWPRHFTHEVTQMKELPGALTCSAQPRAHSMAVTSAMGRDTHPPTSEGPGTSLHYRCPSLFPAPPTTPKTQRLGSRWADALALSRTALPSPFAHWQHGSQDAPDLVSAAAGPNKHALPHVSLARGLLASQPEYTLARFIFPRNLRTGRSCKTV